MDVDADVARDMEIGGVSLWVGNEVVHWYGIIDNSTNSRMVCHGCEYCHVRSSTPPKNFPSLFG